MHVILHPLINVFQAVQQEPQTLLLDANALLQMNVYLNTVLVIILANLHARLLKLQTFLQWDVIVKVMGIVLHKNVLVLNVFLIVGVHLYLKISVAALVLINVIHNIAILLGLALLPAQLVNLQEYILMGATVNKMDSVLLVSVIP
jgi:hypothetical protein